MRKESPCTLRPCFPSPSSASPPFPDLPSAPGSRAGDQTNWGAGAWGKLHSSKSTELSSVLFPYLGRKTAGVSIVPRGQSLALYSPLRHFPAHSTSHSAGITEGTETGTRVRDLPPSPSPPPLYLGLVSVLMYLRSWVSYCAICSGVA